MDAAANVASRPEPPSVPSSAPASGGKYLTFLLGSEGYGVDIRMIREIIGIMEITPLPDSDPSVRGVINLRGRIIPVVDLRTRFGLAQSPFTERTCIVVVDLPTDGGGRTLVGAVVDAVSEVTNIPSADVEPAPEMGMGAEASAIRGIAKLKDRVVVLLDIERALAKVR